MFLFNKIIFLFIKEDVYIGYSIEEVSKVINILKENNIKYTHKVINDLRYGDRFSLSRVGVDIDYQTQYTISVGNSDYAEAKYLVNKGLHP